MGLNDTTQQQLPPYEDKAASWPVHIPRKVLHPQTQVIHSRKQPMASTPIYPTPSCKTTFPRHWGSPVLFSRPLPAMVVPTCLPNSFYAYNTPRESFSFSLTFFKTGSKYLSNYQSVLNCHPSTGPQMGIGDDTRRYLYIISEFVITLSMINISRGL